LTQESPDVIIKSKRQRNSNGCIDRDQSEEVASQSVLGASNQLRFSVSSIDESVPIKILDQNTT
jgi:hypothetical protein